MTSKLALYVRLEAKAGKEEALEAFLKNAQPLAQAESETVSWYAMKFTSTTFGIFDTFNDEAGRKTHLSGKIAELITEKASELLEEPPVILSLEIIASKIPA